MCDCLTLPCFPPIHCPDPFAPTSAMHPRQVLLESRALSELEMDASFLESGGWAILDGLCDANDLLEHDEDEGGYAFRHRSLLEVSYSLLPEELKIQLHLTAAEHYTSIHEGMGEGAELKAAAGGSSGSGVGSSLGSGLGTGVSSGPGAGTHAGRALTKNAALSRMCYHWAQAALGKSVHALTMAAKYLMLAGEHALQLHAHQEAEKPLLEASKLAELSEATAIWLGPLRYKLALAQSLLGKKEARDNANASLCALGVEAKPLHLVTKPQLNKLKRKHRRGIIGWLKQSGYLSMPPVDRTWAPQEEATRKRICAAEAYSLLAEISIQEHAIQVAGYCATRALQLALSLPVLHPVVGRALVSRCMYAAVKGDPGRKVRCYMRQALATCDALGEELHFAETLIAVGFQSAANARWSEAEGYFDTAAAIFKKQRFQRKLEECLLQKAHAAFYRGEFLKSKVLFKQARASAEVRGDPQIQNSCNSGLAGVLLAMNEVEAAHRLLEKTNSLGQAALCALRRQKPVEALTHALACKDRFKGPRTKYYVLKGFSATAEVLLELLEIAYEQRSASAENVSSLLDELRPTLQELSGISEASAPSPASRISRIWGFNKEAASVPASPSESSRNKSRRTTMSASSITAHASSMAAIAGSMAANATTKAKEAAVGATQLAAGALSLTALAFTRTPEGELHELRRHANAWIEKLEQFASLHTVARPRALLFRAKYSLITNRRQQGLRQLATSLSVAKSLKMPYDIGLAQYEFAKASRAPSQKRIRLLEAARHQIEDTGKPHPHFSHLSHPICFHVSPPPPPPPPPPILRAGAVHIVNCSQERIEMETLAER